MDARLRNMNGLGVFNTSLWTSMRRTTCRPVCRALVFGTDAANTQSFLVSLAVRSWFNGNPATGGFWLWLPADFILLDMLHNIYVASRQYGTKRANIRCDISKVLRFVSTRPHLDKDVCASDISFSEVHTAHYLPVSLPGVAWY